MALKDNVFMLVFSSFFSRRGKNFRLAEEVERTLLASGAKIDENPISSNLIYRISHAPNHDWLKCLSSEGIEIEFAKEAHRGLAKESQCYPHGLFCVRNVAMPFWTGPAIEPETKRIQYYVALDAGASSLATADFKPILDSLDRALGRNGATRLEVRLDRRR